MNQDLFNGTRTLAKGRVRRLHGDPGRRIEVLSGTVWLTQDGDSRDVILESGQAFDFDRHGAALLSAFADSRYLLLEGCARH